MLERYGCWKPTVGAKQRCSECVVPTWSYFIQFLFPARLPYSLQVSSQTPIGGLQLQISGVKKQAIIVSVQWQGEIKAKFLWTILWRLPLYSCWPRLHRVPTPHSATHGPDQNSLLYPQGCLRVLCVCLCMCGY